MELTPEEIEQLDDEDKELIARTKAAPKESFKDMLVRRAQSEKGILVNNIINEARSGDKKALDRLVEVALSHDLVKEEEKLDLTDDRFNEIIITRARRILGLLPGQ